jgi:hypothetical protein
LLAHFAIITFGLVATLGHWNDSVTRFSVVCGMSATLCLLCFGLDQRFIRGALALWRGDSFFFIGPVREGSVSHETLDYIRHANLLAGAPPMASSSIALIYKEACCGRCRQRASFVYFLPTPFLYQSGGFHVINRIPQVNE